MILCVCSVEARHHDGDGLPVVPFASDIPSSSSSQTIASDAKVR